jgi:hypothetical protein
METATVMEMVSVAASITTPMQTLSTVDADLMVISVVCVLSEFWQDSIPPRK